MHLPRPLMRFVCCSCCSQFPHCPFAEQDGVPYHVVQSVAIPPGAKTVSELAGSCAPKQLLSPVQADMARRFLVDLHWCSPSDSSGQLRTVNTIFIKLMDANVDPQLETIQKVPFVSSEFYLLIYLFSLFNLILLN